MMFAQIKGKLANPKQLIGVCSAGPIWKDTPKLPGFPVANAMAGAGVTIKGYGHTDNLRPGRTISAHPTHMDCVLVLFTQRPVHKSWTKRFDDNTFPRPPSLGDMMW